MKLNRKPFRIALCVAALVLSACAAQGASAAAYTLTRTDDAVTLHAPDGTVVFSYQTKVPADGPLPSAAFFAPLNTPAGIRVTSVSPKDHPFHRGMYLAFLSAEFRTPPANKPEATTFDVARGDFWGWGKFAPTQDRKIINDNVSLVDANDDHATLKIQNHWAIEGKVVVEETDVVRVTRSGSAYVLDLFYRLKPRMLMVLDQRSFGGFSVQGRDDGSSTYSAAYGKVQLPAPHYSAPSSDWPSEPWYDFTTDLVPEKATAGFAIIDHPLNPPTRWQNLLRFLNPCIDTFEPLSIPATTGLVLRYRVVVHDGAPDARAMEELSRTWRSSRDLPAAIQ